MLAVACALFVLGTSPEVYLSKMEEVVLPATFPPTVGEDEFQPADIIYYRRYVEASSAGNPQQVLSALRHLTALSYLNEPVRACLLAKQATWELGTQQEANANATLNTLRQVVMKNPNACMYVDLAQAKATAECSGNFDEPFEPLTDAIRQQYSQIFSKYDPANRWIIEARLDYALKIRDRGNLDHKHEIELLKLSLSELKKTRQYLDRLAAKNSVAKDPIVQRHIESMEQLADGWIAEVTKVLQRLREEKGDEAFDAVKEPDSTIEPASSPPRPPFEPEKPRPKPSPLPEEVRVEVDAYLDSVLGDCVREPLAREEDPLGHLLEIAPREELLLHLVQVLGDEDRQWIARQRAASCLAKSKDPRGQAAALQLIHRYLQPRKELLTKAEGNVLYTCIASLSWYGTEEALDETFKILQPDYWSAENLPVPKVRQRNGSDTVDEFRRGALNGLTMSGTERAKKALETHEGIPDDLFDPPKKEMPDFLKNSRKYIEIEP